MAAAPILYFRMVQLCSVFIELNTHLAVLFKTVQLVQEPQSTPDTDKNLWIIMFFRQNSYPEDA